MIAHLDFIFYYPQGIKARSQIAMNIREVLLNADNTVVFGNNTIRLVSDISTQTYMELSDEPQYTGEAVSFEKGSNPLKMLVWVVDTDLK